MKKVLLALIAAVGLMVTGCAGNQAAGQPAGTVQASNEALSIDGQFKLGMSAAEVMEQVDWYVYDSPSSGVISISSYDNENNEPRAYGRAMYGLTLVTEGQELTTISQSFEYEDLEELQNLAIMTNGQPTRSKPDADEWERDGVYLAIFGEPGEYGFTNVYITSNQAYIDELKAVISNM